jgi:hypothetical protein
MARRKGSQSGQGAGAEPGTVHLREGFLNRSRRVALEALLLAGLLFVLLCPSASATHNQTDLISKGTGPYDAIYAGAKADGSKVWFMTNEQLDPTDTDSSQDIYERSGNKTTLISTGPAGGNGTPAATFDAASPDGTRVYFHTTEKLVSTDTDNTIDIYQRSGATTTILTIGPTGGNGSNDAFYVGTNESGTRVWFVSYEELTSNDMDVMRKDVYENSGGSVSLISTSSTSPNGAYGADFAGASDDGSHVFFVTDEPLASTDNDGANRDVYERTGGTTNLVSIGPAAGAGTAAVKASWGGTSSDGTHAFFVTSEKLTTEDNDGLCVDDVGANVPCADVYERTGGTTTLTSANPAPADGNYRASFAGVSSDGTRAYFQTDEPIDQNDSDTGCDDYLGNPTQPCIDVYQRSGGTTTMVSTSSTSPNGSYTAVFRDVSEDGTRVFFDTDEPLAPSDGDGSVQDVYERAGGNTTLISTGPAGGSGPQSSDFSAISSDGSRVFFVTYESLVSSDADGNWLDVYERVGGTTTLLSTGPSGGGASFVSFFGGSTQDGSRVYFQTDEAEIPADTDVAQDVYVAIAGYAPPIGASPMRISFVPAFTPCALPMTGTHAGPLSGSSCNPPTPRSSLVAVGSRSIGFTRLKVLANGECTPFNPALCYPDLQIGVNITDVRSGGPSGPDYSTPSTQDLTLVATLPNAGASQGDFARVTDKYNKLNSGTDFNQAATTVPMSFPISLSCSTTTDTTIGSTCATQTTGNSLVPGTISVGNRAIWEIGQLQVLDQGANGTAGDSDDKVFEVQGLFAP